MTLRTLLLTATCALISAAPACAQPETEKTPEKIVEQTPVQSAAQEEEKHVHEEPIARSTPKDTVLPGTFSQLDTDHVTGDKDAPVTMIIYASVTCPHCAHWFETVWPDLKINYIETNKLKVVFREFPTAPAQIAVAGFQLANCGPEDQYFSMIEHLMTEQENTMHGVQGGKGLEVFLAHAKKAGINTEEDMNACFDNKDGLQRIQNTMELAQSGKINSVPAFILDGKFLDHSSDYDPLTKHIDELLKAAKKN